ncbi:ABC transporter substrate-binding protein [Alicyclobacillus ferrooxydans]|uniref:ABC transporter substrate-binding protein n=1 Tax=Alicyclobacillus ferrooxydans TaxID=471514 RepID=UPI0006D5AF65|nr:ABC transporter substrate-binding protein [Alicyclobacillus ferrooxydans]
MRSDTDQGLKSNHLPSFRIASLCPSNTELICALGLQGCLVGVDSYSDYPQDVVADLPKLGPDLNIDIDALNHLQPDLVVSSLSVPGMEKVVEAVEHAGLRQVILSPRSFADIYADLRTLAAHVPDDVLAGGEAERIVHQLEQRVERVRAWTNQNIPDYEQPKLYWEWWAKPVFSPGGRNWLTELSQAAGARNIFADLDHDSVQDDGTLVCDANPDWFLAVWTGIPQHKVPIKKILSRPAVWQDTVPFTKHQLLILSEGLFCRPSQRLVDGLEQLVGILHPTSIVDLDLKRPEEYAPVRRADGSWLGGLSSPQSSLGLSGQ